ncbi:FixH family protein [Sphingobacterium mizutaii]|uniref:FixH family protein n=1 Tax=Sphingobacterium mizutaii TaxID=1010 RepID=UPI0028A61596|nr:FixH family protein [Sphingobacterium mizutaii]
MNWGYKIVFGLGAFMLFIVGAGIYMVSHDSDTLVESDYYEKGLNYDETFHKKENLLADHAKPKLQLLKDSLLIEFSAAGNKGNLKFTRLDDKNLDQILPFNTTNNQFKLPVGSFKKGNWKLEIDWVHSDKSYISDHAVFIQ